MIINKKTNGGKYQRSTLEVKFEKLWQQLAPDLDLVVEQTLIPGTKYRTDYLHEKTKIAIEVHGGQYLKHGGHVGKGATTDAIKQNNLVQLGYLPFVLWTSMVRKKYIIEIRDYIRRCLNGNNG